jgi:flagellar M-ring protein FliF
VQESAWWQQGDNQELMRNLAWPLGMLGLGALILLGMVRPGLKLMKSAPPALAKPEPQQLSAVVDETNERPGLPMPEPAAALPMSAHETRLANARQLALQDPMAVANIVKGWVSGDAAA